MSAVDPDRLRVALARLNVTKQRLAQLLGKPPSTLSTWLRGVAPGPEDLAERIEEVLKLKRGSLAASRSSTTRN